MHPYGAGFKRWYCGLVAASLIANVAVADSTTGQKLFDDGNGAFRRGNFEHALASYTDALANGKDTPRVFYNMGLAHFRLGQHEQARWAFIESSKNDELAALSFYQLGALAEREGKREEAVDWLRRARDNARSDKLRRQSTKALAIIGVAQPGFDSSMSVGFGYDSNAFRSPDEPYIDLSTPVPTPVAPDPQSGPYVPVRVQGEYRRPLSAGSTFTASYRFRGEYHTDTELQNADTDDHRITIGAERRIGKSRAANRSVAIEGFYRMHGETNFDRDDGLDRFDDGQSIVDRYDYQSIGTELDMKSRIGSTRYSIGVGAEQRDYDDVPTASSYDMTNYWLGGEVRLPLSGNSRLRLGYEYYVRDYDERRAKDLTGDASSSNPTLEYQYHELSAGLKHRFGNGFVGEITYFYTVRNDEFVDYNGYTRNKIRLSGVFDLGNRLQSSIRLDYRDQVYSNAFAFDNPSQAQKEYEDLEVILAVAYRLTERLSVRADLRQEIVESSDPRGEYERLRGAIAVHWGYE